jgi:hypothetical protein
MSPLRSLAHCLRCAAEALRLSAPGNDPASPGQPPGPPALPSTPRPLKWLWAAGVTGAVVAELAATSTGPFAELLRGFLQSAGAPVRESGPGGAAGMECECDCRGAQIGGPAVEAGAGGGPPADQSIPRPAPRP